MMNCKISTSGDSWIWIEGLDKIQAFLLHSENESSLLIGATGFKHHANAKPV